MQFDSTELVSISDERHLRTCFTPAALARLKSEIIQGFKSLPRRGAEVGGLLIGAIHHTTGEPSVRVEKIQPIPIEYKFGPSWRLSPVDEQSVRLALKSEGIIGWYRSHTGAGRANDAEDNAFTAKFFGTGPVAFLLCYPDASCNIPAKLRVSGIAEEVEANFDLGQAEEIDEPRAETAALETAPVPAPRWQTTLAVAPLAPPPAVRPIAPAASVPVSSRPSGISWRGALIPAAMAVALIAGFEIWTHPRPSAAAPAPPQRVDAAPPSTGLGLAVDREAGALRVHWNRSAPELQRATGGSFTIVDGDRTQVVPLTSRELLAGGILYTPNGGDVRMELAIHTPSNSSTEYLRVIGGAPATPKVNSAASAFVVDAPRAVDPRPAPASGAMAAPRKFVPPPPQSAPVETKKPLIEARVPDLAAGPLQLPSSPVLPAFRGVPDPAPDPGFVPAHAVYTVQPAIRRNGAGIPESLLAQSQNPPEVDVDVTINAMGIVTDVKTSRVAGPAANLLVESAMVAASHWRFAPATLHGRPIESRMILKFIFGKSSERRP